MLIIGSNVKIYRNKFSKRQFNLSVRVKTEIPPVVNSNSHWRKTVIQSYQECEMADRLLVDQNDSKK